MKDKIWKIKERMWLDAHLVKYCDREPISRLTDKSFCPTLPPKRAANLHLWKTNTKTGDSTKTMTKTNFLSGICQVRESQSGQVTKISIINQKSVLRDWVARKELSGTSQVGGAVLLCYPAPEPPHPRGWHIWKGTGGPSTNPTLHTTSATDTKVVLAPNSDAQLGGLHTPTFYTAGAQSGARLWFTLCCWQGGPECSRVE